MFQLPTALLCLLSFRLSQNLDGVVIEFLFRQSKISEVLGGSGYNSDRLCLPYIPQLTGMRSGPGFPPYVCLSCHVNALGGGGEDT